ncbi:MAG: hypothetical protein K2K14_06000, partial [Ruminococcus sp.]|nr:hypothetical protein [Ruminococcus sp.]
MKTNSLKKAFAALAISAVAVSATSISAFAANDVKGPDNGFTADEIAASDIKATVSVDRVTLTLKEAKDLVENDTPVNIAVTVASDFDDSEDGFYSATGFHIDYDTRLSIVKGRTKLPDIKLGDGGAALALTTEEYPGGVFVTTSGSGDFGFNGVLYTLQFKLPADVAAGDVYPVEIIYRSAPNAMDRFTNATDDRTGKLMQGYVFTRGIVQGYIEIEGEPDITTTTTAPTTTAATTAPTTTAPTTTAPTTTAPTTTAPTTTSTTTTTTTTTTTNATKTSTT